MADVTTRWIFKAVDEASKVLNNVNKAAGNMKKDFSSLIKEVPGLGSAMRLATNPISLVGEGLFKAAEFANKAAKETVDYTKTVRDMAEILNIGTEETSRIIQTADDYGISIDKVKTALQLALKNGFAPTVDTLADMADKYNEIQDPTERAAELTKVFGRNWSELTPMLKEGGKAIREAAAAQSASLLVTEKGAQAARDYEIAMDKWGDTLQGIKYSVGKEWIPILTNATEAVNDYVDATIEGKERLDDLRKAEELGIIIEKDATRIRGEMAIGLVYVGQISDDLTAKVDEYTKSIDTASEADIIRAKALNEQSIPATEDYTEANKNAAYAIYEVNEAALGKAAIDALNEAYADGAISTADYEQRLGFLMTQMLNMDPQAATTTIKMADLKKQLDEGKITADQYIEKVYGLYNAMKTLDGTRATTYINTVEEGTTMYRGKDRRGFQHGVRDFIVPEGFPNDSFMLPVTSGERVNVTPAGGNVSNVYNYNLNMSSNAPTSTIARDFAYMRSMPK